MAARTSRRAPSLSLPIDATAGSEFRSFRMRTPLFTVSAGRVLVTLTLPERLGPGDVEFARGLAEQAAAYAIEVERLYRSGRRSPSGSSAHCPAGRSGKGRAR